MEAKPFADILRLTLDAWNEMPTKVFESAWVITGYFEATHFETYRHLTPAEGHQEAYKVMEPAQVLTGWTFRPTPQMCPVYQWQIKAWLPY